MSHSSARAHDPLAFHETDLASIPVTPQSDPRAIQTSSGHQLALLPGSSDTVQVRSAAGVLELELRFSPTGVVLSSPSGSLSLHAREDISFDCDRFRVRARRALDLESAGDVVVTAAGNVDVHGEQILLNC